MSRRLKLARAAFLILTVVVVGAAQWPFFQPDDRPPPPGLLRRVMYRVQSVDDVEAWHNPSQSGAQYHYVKRFSVLPGPASFSDWE